MSTIIDQAKNAINVWNDTRNNSTAVSNYFNQGAYFEISIEDFEAWNSNNPTEIHAYMGLEIPSGEPNFALHLFSVDNITDQKPVESHQAEYLEKLKKSIYQEGKLENTNFHPALKGSSTDIPTIDALKAVFRWSLQKNFWVNQSKEDNMIQVFEIPFQDLKQLFIEEKAKSILVVPALKKHKNELLNIDLMLWGYDSNKGIIDRPADFIKPAPPFSKQETYQLLNYALNL